MDNGVFIKSFADGSSYRVYTRKRKHYTPDSCPCGDCSRRRKIGNRKRRGGDKIARY